MDFTFPPPTSERDYLDQKAARKYIADLEEEARLNPGTALKPGMQVSPRKDPDDSDIKAAIKAATKAAKRKAKRRAYWASRGY